MYYDGIGFWAWYGPIGGSNVKSIASEREIDPTTFASKL